MHPIEHLRWVARATGADPSMIARESAGALEAVAAEDPAGLVLACRRLVERHPSVGPLWWLCARVLGAADPEAAARDAAAALAADRTDRHLATALPDDGTVLVIGWPDLVGRALRRRGDLEVLVVDHDGDGLGLARRLADSGNVVSVVPGSGTAPAATVAGLVLVEALAAGPGGFLAAPGSGSAAAVASVAGTPVHAVIGVGRVLPGRLWDALLGRLDASGLEPWEREAEVVQAGMVTDAVGPDGPVELGEALANPTCPVAPELLRLGG
jgi:hypothetical protein